MTCACILFRRCVFLAKFHDVKVTVLDVLKKKWGKKIFNPTSLCVIGMSERTDYMNVVSYFLLCILVACLYGYSHQIVCNIAV